MNRSALFTLLLLFAATLASANSMDIPAPCSHPRLLLKAGEETALRESLASDRLRSDAYDSIKSYSDRLLKAEPLQRVLTGRRLLAVSRDALTRIFYLSTAYRIEGDRKYADRAIEEMLDVCRFPDWNPSHFLDVGEMTMAVAIGYDWLYSELTPEQRKEIREAIVSKAFLPSRDHSYGWFYRATNNWNQVCNAGLVYGALAIFEDEKDYSESIIQRCFETNPNSLGSYSPEGGYPEGYSYWGYGTSFQVMLVAALQSSFGSDLGLMDGREGFYNSSEFIKMMSTPSGHCFNFYDCDRRQSFNIMQVWMANVRNDNSVLYPEVAFFRKNGLRNVAGDRFLPMLLIFGRDVDFQNIKAPSDHFYECSGNTPLFIFRSGWESEDDTYLGVKGGKASDSHGHIDAGSFIFESDGVSWAMDLGNQDYFSLENAGVDLWNPKQNSQRWDVYRIGPLPHNILTVEGRRPQVDARVNIARTWKEKSCKGALMHTTAFYGGDLDSSFRKVYLDRKNNLHIDDFIVGGDSARTLRWAMCTEAEARILSPDVIELKKDGKVRLLKISTAHQASPAIWTTKSSNEYDAANPGSCLAGFVIKDVEPHQKVTLKVSLAR